MYVTAHAITRLFDRIGGPQAESIVTRLEALPGESDDVAIEVYRTPRDAAQRLPIGDQVIVIAREGTVETVMFRRSWNQPFTAYALGVDRVERMPA